MVALLFAAALAAQPVPSRTIGRASVTILSGAEIHFDRTEERREHRLKPTTIRGEDGIRRSALLIEFQ